jgi:hypothetical protein
MNESQAGAMLASLVEQADTSNTSPDTTYQDSAENLAALDSPSVSAGGLCISSAPIGDSKRGDGELDREQRSILNKAAARYARDSELAAVRRGEVTAWEQHQRELAATRGRPSEFDSERAASLCQWVAAGNSMRSWCRQSGVAGSTVQRWLAERADFRARYSQARADRADSLADEIQEIADNSQGGSIEDVQAAKLRVEARKWIASKLKPETWGDKTITEHKGGVSIRIGVPSPSPIHAGEVIENTGDASPALPTR